jgi:hypothetical protein
VLGEGRIQQEVTVLHIVKQYLQIAHIMVSRPVAQIWTAVAETSLQSV